jgi:hypothetical protein
MEDPKRNWDLEHIYDTEIAPLMSRIIEICKANNLPMFATFVYANGEDDGEDYCTTYVVSAKPQEQKAILAAILLPAHYEWPEEREAPAYFKSLWDWAVAGGAGTSGLAPLRLTLKDKDGNVKEITEIH